MTATGISLNQRKILPQPAESLPARDHLKDFFKRPMFSKIKETITYRVTEKKRRIRDRVFTVFHYHRNPKAAFA